MRMSPLASGPARLPTDREYLGGDPSRPKLRPTLPIRLGRVASEMVSSASVASAARSRVRVMACLGWSMLGSNAYADPKIAIKLCLRISLTAIDCLREQ